MRLKSQTPISWAHYVVDNMDAFLCDHAACERKASALALSLAAHYNDKPDLVHAMIDLALEELEHFKQVYQVMRARNIHLENDTKDPYVNAFLKFVRRGTPQFFLDRLLIAGVIEARGCERFGLVAKVLPKGELKEFYLSITRSEARHHGLFVRLAKRYFDASEVELRLDQLLTNEAKIASALPIRPAVH